MEFIGEKIYKPTKKDQLNADTSARGLQDALANIDSELTEIEIEETPNKIVVPVSALRFLSEMLTMVAAGKAISIIPVGAEVTTQKAADILGCSRPFLVKLLEDHKIPFVKIGKHRRIQLEDVLKYKNEMKVAQREALIELMNMDEEAGLYDS